MIEPQAIKEQMIDKGPTLNRWIISRTRSSEVDTSRAITGTVFPPADACTTSARRHFTIDLSEAATATSHDLGDLTTLHLGEPTHSRRLRHHPSLRDRAAQVVDAHTNQP